MGEDCDLVGVCRVVADIDDGVAGGVSLGFSVGHGCALQVASVVVIVHDEGEGGFNLVGVDG